MFTRIAPQVTRPNHSLIFVKPQNPSDSLTPQPQNLPFSPLSFFQQTSKFSPILPTISGSMTSPTSAMSPRAPIVHFFVGDYGNAKVKTLTDQFVQILTDNGIDVYVEKYSTHQPGYQVRAASLSTLADFFYQIHSKTAGPGHVRLYEGGQPKRMTTEEAVATIWSNWRSKCGSLSSEEVDLLSKEKLIFLLKEFANIEPQNFDIASMQIQARDAIERGICVRPIADKLHSFESMLHDGRTKILTTKTMCSDWNKDKGQVLTKISPSQQVKGLSQPLKDVLVCVIEQTMKKVRAIIDILDKHYTPNTSHAFIEKSTMPFRMPTSEGSENKTGDGSSWKIMVESADEDRVGSVRIASYGDGYQSSEAISTPVIMLDDY
ncbi:hypothetical protein TRFO_29364 [Tritrichomonas foetus]|uniref:Uncharacterized protein n=1 Tax=Tritrichomonas foetus TaxID=1144522 RepID=A0A1J4JX78_9EUKA|nr:hypothetical protein TRFO_29364 [Tritrichomonas foetus]|eukprot:OHT03274.1 hypothetical protein TRFO_29364 [Tritrichomonas foetus]